MELPDVRVRTYKYNLGAIVTIRHTQRNLHLSWSSSTSGSRSVVRPPTQKLAIPTLVGQTARTGRHVLPSPNLQDLPHQGR